MFAFLAMMYYGIILFEIRRPKKGVGLLRKKEATDNEDLFSRLDKLMFAIYISSFVIYNFVHFSKFLEKMI